MCEVVCMSEWEHNCQQETSHFLKTEEKRHLKHIHFPYLVPLEGRIVQNSLLKVCGKMGKLCSFLFKCVVLNFFVYKYLIPRMASKQSSYVKLVIHRLFILYSIAVLLIYSQNYICRETEHFIFTLIQCGFGH